MNTPRKSNGPAARWWWRKSTCLGWGSCRSSRIRKGASSECGSRRSPLSRPRVLEAGYGLMRCLLKEADPSLRHVELAASHNRLSGQSPGVLPRNLLVYHQGGDVGAELGRVIAVRAVQLELRIGGPRGSPRFARREKKPVDVLGGDAIRVPYIIEHPEAAGLRPHHQ